MEIASQRPMKTGILESLPVSRTTTGTGLPDESATNTPLTTHGIWSIEHEIGLPADNSWYRQVTLRAGSYREQFPVRCNTDKPCPQCGVQPAVAVTESRKGTIHPIGPVKPCPSLQVRCSDEDDPLPPAVPGNPGFCRRTTGIPTRIFSWPKPI